MKTAIGIPIVDSVPGENWTELVSTVMEVGRVSDVLLLRQLNTMPHTRARANIVKNALEENCDYLFFIDDDMVIPQNSFEELLGTMRKTQAAVVSGHYYRRGYPYHSVWSKEIEGQWFPVDADTDIWPIHCSGLGCALIDLHWLRDHVQAPWFETEMDSFGPNVTDDVTFFRKVVAAGGKVYGHGGIRCGHLGSRMVICDKTVDFLRKLHIEQQTP